MGNASKMMATTAAAWAFGPNHEQVAGIIDRASRMTEDEAGALGDRWTAVGHATGVYAFNQAYDTAYIADLYDAAHLAIEVAIATVSAEPARYAVRDTALACVVRNSISEETFQTLTGPWLEAIGNIE
ncbi:MAG: hypothetical protein M0000_13645 [Actinomycetota bacterium]|nr:hypothetical protein [Actinomycetota bacterium]